MNEPRVTVIHCRRLEYCVPGLKKFAENNGLDFKQLVREGWAVSELKRIRDLYVDAAVALAVEEWNGK